MPSNSSHQAVLVRRLLQFSGRLQNVRIQTVWNRS